MKTSALLMLAILFMGLSTMAVAGGISLSPASGTHGDNFDVQVLLDTGGSVVTTTQAYLQFDTAVLSVQNGSAGIDVASIWNMTVEKTVLGNAIKVTVGSTTGGNKGNSVLVATLHMQALKDSSSAGVTFDRSNTTALNPSNNNVVQAFTDSSFTLTSNKGGIFGDVTGDGKVDTYDALAIFAYDNYFSRNLERLNAARGAAYKVDLTYGDVTEDGKVDTYDALAIFAYDNYFSRNLVRLNNARGVGNEVHIGESATRTK